MAFSVSVETINIQMRAAKPVRLRGSMRRIYGGDGRLALQRPQAARPRSRRCSRRSR